MRNNSSFLGAADSPQSVQPAGVRRLNHIPLFIIGAVAAVVAVLLAFVAFDKSKPPAPKQEDHGGSADDYAAQVVGNKSRLRTRGEWRIANAVAYDRRRHRNDHRHPADQRGNGCKAQSFFRSSLREKRD